MDDVVTRPITVERWPDLVSVFGRRGEDPAWCWCRLFVDVPGERSTPAPPNKPEVLYREIEQSRTPPGLLAYRDDKAVGWTRVGPRRQFPGVVGNPRLSRALGDDGGTVWWVACFVVESRHRRSGVGRALLQGAVEFARGHGASALEGYPVDVARLQAARVSGSALYTGTMAMFLAAGFSEAARPSPTRPLMRKVF